MPTGSKRKESPSSSSSSTSSSNNTEINSKAWGELRRIDTSTWAEGPDVFYLEGRSCNVGRVASRGIDIVIDLAVISSKHCTLEPGDKIAGGQMTCILSDHSTNGTFVDNERVGRGNRLTVMDGMSVSFGKLNAGSKKKKWEIPIYKLVLHDGRNPPKKKARLMVTGGSGSPGRAQTDMNSKLQRNNDRLREELSKEQEKMKQIKDETEQLKAQLGQGRDTLNKENDKVRDAEIDRLKDALKQMEGVADSHKKEAQLQSSRALKSENEMKEMERRLDERNREHGMVETEATHLQEKMKSMETDLDSSRRDAETSQNELSSIKLTLIQLEEEKLKNEKLIEKQQNELEQLKLNELKHQEMSKEMKSHADGMKKTLEESRDEMSKLLEKYNELKTEMTTLTSVKKSLEKELVEKSNQITKCGAAMNKSRTSLLAREKEIATLQREVENLQLRFKRAQQRVVSLSEREEIQRQRAANTRQQIVQSLPGIHALLAHLTEAAKPSEVDNGSQVELLSSFSGSIAADGVDATQPDDEDEEMEELSPSKRHFVSATQHQGTPSEAEENDGGEELERVGEEGEEEDAEMKEQQGEGAGEGEEASSGGPSTQMDKIFQVGDEDEDEDDDDSQTVVGDDDSQSVVDGLE